MKEQLDAYDLTRQRIQTAHEVARDLYPVDDTMTDTAATEQIVRRAAVINDGPRVLSEAARITEAAFQRTQTERIVHLGHIAVDAGLKSEVDTALHAGVQPEVEQAMQSGIAAATDDLMAEIYAFYEKNDQDRSDS